MLANTHAKVAKFEFRGKKTTRTLPPKSAMMVQELNHSTFPAYSNVFTASIKAAAEHWAVRGWALPL
jgi:hypothetical protein